MGVSLRPSRHARPLMCALPAVMHCASCPPPLTALRMLQAPAQYAAGFGAKQVSRGCVDIHCRGGTGEEADYYLYFTAANYQDWCDGAVAWATACLLDDDNYQPRIGTANFCPNQIGLLSSDPEGTIAVLLHEIIHALVRLQHKQRPSYHACLCLVTARNGSCTAAVRAVAEATLSSAWLWRFVAHRIQTSPFSIGAVVSGALRCCFTWNAGNTSMQRASVAHCQLERLFTMRRNVTLLFCAAAMAQLRDLKGERPCH